MGMISKITKHTILTLSVTSFSLKILGVKCLSVYLQFEFWISRRHYQRIGCSEPSYMNNFSPFSPDQYFVRHHHNVFSWCSQRAKKIVLCLDLSALCVVLFVFRVSFKQQSGLWYFVHCFVCFLQHSKEGMSSVCQPRVCKFLKSFLNKYTILTNLGAMLLCNT